MLVVSNSNALTCGGMFSKFLFAWIVVAEGQLEEEHSAEMYSKMKNQKIAVGLLQGRNK